jgi:hypothetical protein
LAEHSLVARDLGGQNAALFAEAHRHRAARSLRDDVDVERTAGELERGDDVLARRHVHRGARARIVERRRSGIERVDARRRDDERLEARVVRRLRTGHLVDLAVAVVVLAVVAYLDVLRVDRRIAVVAVAPRHAVAVGRTVAVGVAQMVLARPRGFDAAVDGAGHVVVAVEDRALAATEVGVAPFDPVAIDAVLAPGIVEDELAALEIVVAGIQRAIHPVVTLIVGEARLTQDGPVGRASVARAPIGEGVGPLSAILDERARAAAARASGREENHKPER